jgi:hypothetical protein
VESLKVAITTGAAATASVNTSLAAVAADIANVSAAVSATNFTDYAKTADLANVNAVSLGGVPAAQYLRARVVLYM